jgi:hypothetical protein
VPSIPVVKSWSLKANRFLIIGAACVLKDSLSLEDIAASVNWMRVSTLLTIADISVEKTNSLVPEQADAIGDLNSRFKRVFEL